MKTTAGLGLILAGEGFTFNVELIPDRILTNFIKNLKIQDTTFALLFVVCPAKSSFHHLFRECSAAEEIIIDIVLEFLLEFSWK